MGLGEALASACHGEAPDKLPPPSRLGKEKGGPEVAGRPIARGSLVFCTGNSVDRHCLQPLEAVQGGVGWMGELETWRSSKWILFPLSQEGDGRELPVTMRCKCVNERGGRCCVDV